MLELKLPLSVEKARSYSPLTLAFLGDSVYEVLVRESIALEGSRNVASLHKRAVEKVRATFQAKAMDVIEPLLTEEESDIFRRGRNAHNNSVPKTSSIADYRRATGLEALFGYLHLMGRQERIEELFSAIWNSDIV